MRRNGILISRSRGQMMMSRAIMIHELATEPFSFKFVTVIKTKCIFSISCPNCRNIGQSEEQESVGVRSEMDSEFMSSLALDHTRAENR